MAGEHLLAYILLGGLACLLVVAVLRGLRGLLGPAPLPYFSKDRLLSKGELAFYRVLRQVIPASLSASMKVRLCDVIGCTGDGWRAGFGAKISQKHIDFVLIDAATTDIRLAIELDDRTHQRADRRDRDTFVDRALATAGVPILRVPAAARYDLAALRCKLNAALRDARRG
jgi:hypothetical protein